MEDKGTKEQQMQQGRAQALKENVRKKEGIFLTQVFAPGKHPEASSMQRDPKWREIVERNFKKRCLMHRAPNLSKNSGSSQALQLKSAGSNSQTSER